MGGIGLLLYDYGRATSVVYFKFSQVYWRGIPCVQVYTSSSYHEWIPTLVVWNVPAMEREVCSLEHFLCCCLQTSGSWWPRRRGRKTNTMSNMKEIGGNRGSQKEVRGERRRRRGGQGGRGWEIGTKKTTMTMVARLLGRLSKGSSGRTFCLYNDGIHWDIGMMTKKGRRARWWRGWWWQEWCFYVLWGGGELFVRKKVWTGGLWGRGRGWYKRR